MRKLAPTSHWVHLTIRAVKSALAVLSRANNFCFGFEMSTVNHNYIACLELQRHNGSVAFATAACRAVRTHQPLP